MAPCTGVSIAYNGWGGQGVTSRCPPTSQTVHMRQLGSTESTVTVSIVARVPSAAWIRSAGFVLTVSSHTRPFGPPGHPQDPLTASVTSCSYGESGNSGTATTRQGRCRTPATPSRSCCRRLGPRLRPATVHPDEGCGAGRTSLGCPLCGQPEARSLNVVRVGHVRPRPRPRGRPHLVSRGRLLRSPSWVTAQGRQSPTRRRWAG